jgi:two-component system OmpR family sensor kinase
MTRRMTRWTLRRRLVVVLVGLFVAVVGGVGIVSTLALHGVLVDQLDRRVAEASERAVGFPDAVDDGSLRPHGDGRGRPDGPPAGIDALGQGAGTVNLTESDAGVVAQYIDAGGDKHDLSDAQAAALESVPTDAAPYTVEIADLGQFRVQAVTTQTGATVVTGLQTDDMAAVVGDYVVWLVVATGAGIAVAALAGGVLVRR